MSPASFLTWLALALVTFGCERKDPSASYEAATRCGAGRVPREGGRCCAAAAGPCTEVAVVAMRASIPARQFEFGATDWEARGAVVARRVETAAFALDVYELTAAEVGQAGDPARAAAGLTRKEAQEACARKGGRLPTDDEWLAAAAVHRYPWGDTGLVCRRAAWGLAHGPCARGATGPDTVGAHPDGASADGVHDLTGNVAEWVDLPSGEGRVRGGSWADDFAGSLRSWSARTVDPSAHDARIGARCAFAE